MSKDLKYIIGLIAIIAICSALFYVQRKQMESIAAERDRYARNTEALMNDVEHYKVNDSLSAARVEALELTVKEYQKYRAEDAALIKQLKTKNRDLQGVITSQSQTIVELRATPKDTVIVRDSVKMKARLVHCGDAWYDFDGLITEDSFEGNMVSRDSLLIAETVRYKRFLGFLWRTNKIKDRSIDVLPKNPHTMIQDCEIITIKEK